MVIYSKTEERFLSAIGNIPNAEKGIAWKDVLDAGLESYAGWFVRTEHVYTRGTDIEELTMALTGDTQKAWKAAEPYYRYACSKGHAEAAYRCACWVEQNYGMAEFLYPKYLAKAVKAGHRQAMRDYVRHYDAFRARTITRDVWKRMKQQEKLYFECCRTLAEEGDVRALWALGTCYLQGTGVNADPAKGIVMRSQALKAWDRGDGALEAMAAEQAHFREHALAEDETFFKFFLRNMGNLIKPDKKPDAGESGSGQRRT